MLRRKWSLALAMFVTMGMASLAMAQPGGGGGGRGPGGPGGFGGPGGNFDPAQFRQMMMNRMKEQFGATDDEWKVLQPKIEAVQTAQRDTRGGGMGFGPRGGPGGPGGFGRGGPGGGDQALSPVQKAAMELRQAIDNKDTAADDVKAKLAAYREARATAQKKLQDAQKEFQELLTGKQEAVAVSMGLLD